jgi:hypothetical protein
VRAQLLATEHWSLLASRSTTQSEVLTRISIFLTLVSAGLVSLALVGQATGFSDAFGIFAVAVLAVVSLIGILTQMRVANVGFEDLMYVLAMNRLRAAYVELDPGLAPFLMASRHDDRAGSVHSYDFFGTRRDFSQVAGSSMMLIIAVNSAMIGLLAAAMIGLFAPAPFQIGVGVLIGFGYCGVAVEHGRRRYFAIWRIHTPLSPTPPEAGQG